MLIHAQCSMADMHAQGWSCAYCTVCEAICCKCENSEGGCCIEESISVNLRHTEQTVEYETDNPLLAIGK